MKNINLNMHEFLPTDLTSFSLFKNNIDEYPYYIKLNEITNYYKLSYPTILVFLS